MHKFEYITATDSTTFATVIAGSRYLEDSTIMIVELRKLQTFNRRISLYKYEFNGYNLLSLI